MSEIFNAKSPLGYTVSCSTEIWYSHIVSRHPIMKGLESYVKNSIENPDAIYQSNEYNNRDVYFGSFAGNNDLYTKVIVEQSNENTFDTVTAFPQKGIQGNIDNEVLKYVKPKL